MAVPWRILSLLRMGSVLAIDYHPNFQQSFTSHASALHSHLLSSYSPAIAPSSPRDVNASSAAGTDVSMQLRFFKINTIDAANGKMSLKVWYRLKWIDTRLAWNASDWGGITMITFLTGPTGNEIWVPDLQPYNSDKPISATLDYAAVTGSADGTQFWSRPGNIEILCKFSGLVAFPYDTLTCSVEVGGWGWSGGFQGMSLLNGGYEFSDQETTAGSSYTEYSISGVTVELTTHEYACCPNEPWPIATFKISLGRATSYYVNTLLWPYVALTYVAFWVFFMSYKVGERLAFGITLILAVEVSKGLVINLVPICGELLWVEIFLNLNLLFCLLALFETCVVLFLAYHTEARLPEWVTALYAAAVHVALPPALARRAAPASPFDDPLDDEASREPSFGALFFRKWNAHRSAGGGLAPPAGGTPTPLRSRPAVDGTLPRTAAVDWEPAAAAAAGSSRLGADGGALGADDFERLLTFEQLFIEIDAEAHGYIGLVEINSFLSYVAPYIDFAARKEVIARNNKDADDHFVAPEFIALCAELLWDVPLPQLAVGVATYKAARHVALHKSNMRWKRAAKWVDRQARLWVPAAYTTLLVAVFQVDLSDQYDERPQSMFEGWAPTALVGAGSVLAILAVPLIIGLLLASAAVLKHVARQKKLLAAPTKGELLEKRRQSQQEGTPVTSPANSPVSSFRTNRSASQTEV